MATEVGRCVQADGILPSPHTERAHALIADLL